MAVIKFTKADVLRSRNLEGEKWYSWTIARVEGPKVSKGGDSYNYTISLSLIDESPELDGKEVQRVYNSKAISMMIPLVAATQGKRLEDIDPDAFDIDTDQLVGAKVDGKYKLEPYEGQLVGKVEEYLPYRAAKGKAVAF
jgi:hypothetical protein